MSFTETFEEPDSVEVPFFNIHPPKEDLHGAYQMNKNVNLVNLDMKNKMILTEHQERLKAMKERYKQMGQMVNQAIQPPNNGYLYDQTKAFTDSKWEGIMSSWWYIFAAIGVFILFLWGVIKLLKYPWVKRPIKKASLNQKIAERRLHFFDTPKQNDPLFWRR